MGLRRNQTAGFSMIQTMVSTAIFAGVMVATMLTYGKLKRKEMHSQLSIQQQSMASQINSMVSQDLENAILLTGKTIAGELYGANDTPVETFGLMRYPNSDPGDDISDGIAMLVLDFKNSTDSSFRVTDCQPSSGDYELTVTGNFNPIDELSGEDLFVLNIDSQKELLSVKGDITYANGESIFLVNEDLSIDDYADPSVEDFCELIVTEGGDPIPPNISRVDQRIYQVGALGGLYRTSYTQQRLIASNVSSMQVRYVLNDRSGLALANSDCQNRNLDRYLPSDGGLDTNCNYNNVVNVQLEIVFESKEDVGEVESINPHDNSTNGKVRTVVTLSQPPSQYLESSN